MNTEALNKAIASLKFVDVFVTNSTCNLNPDFDPKFDARSENLSFQTKNFVTASAVIEGEGEDGLLQMFRVTSELGIRVVCKDDVEAGVDEPEVLALVEATMEADYSITDASIIDDQEALDTFALNNVSYHVWPYWREYVTSQLLRMNMPKLVLPMLLRASNQEK
jgi:hypothetical protein